MTKILIIDDDQGILESLKFLFEFEGIEPLTAESIDILDEIPRLKPDLILVDYWLPKLNGGEVAEKLKSQESTRNIPLIIMSASYNVKELIENTGADDFIAKPYDINYLLKKIHQHLDSKSN